MIVRLNDRYYDRQLEVETEDDAVVISVRDEDGDTIHLCLDAVQAETLSRHLLAWARRRPREERFGHRPRRGRS